MLKRLIILFIFSTLLSGCFIFRPKNRCGDCPTWNKHGGHGYVKASGNGAKV